MSLPQLLGVERSVIVNNQENEFVLIYMISDCDPEQKNIFMQYCVENDCVIQKIFWVSRFDREEITLTEPTVYDAYNCVVVVKNNDINKLLNAKYLFADRVNKINYLKKCFSQGGTNIKTCMEIEQEKNPINLEKLANLILASLFHRQ